MSALVTSEISRQFVNTLTPDDKYSRRYMQIFFTTTSKAFISKTNAFFLIFYCISEICTKFTTFLKKKQYPSLIITEIIASEGDVYLNV